MSRRPRYWPLVSIALGFLVFSVAGLLWDENLSAPAARSGLPTGVVYGIGVVVSLLLLAVAGHAWWQRRKTRHRDNSS